jgi:hypothetical protein
VSCIDPSSALLAHTLQLGLLYSRLPDVETKHAFFASCKPVHSLRIVRSCITRLTVSTAHLIILTDTEHPVLKFPGSQLKTLVIENCKGVFNEEKALRRIMQPETTGQQLAEALRHLATFIYKVWGYLVMGGKPNT